MALRTPSRNAPKLIPPAPRTRRKSLEDRFWSKVDRTGDCWVWTASRIRSGYGQFRINTQSVVPAHRVAYELTVGKIPDGLELDHLCHGWDEACAGGDSCPHRLCVNPAHLEPVTQKVNALRGRAPSAFHARKTHCKHGHEFSPENTRVNARGHRRCRTCERAGNAIRGAKFRAKRKEAAA